VQQYILIWKALTFNRKLILIGASAGVFLAIFAMSRIVSSPSMILLYGGLEASSAGEVVRVIEQQGIAYEVRGGSIFVDSRQRDELRLTLASEGLPPNAMQGYEILDTLSGFGTTSQMFDVAYWRAKEGELARTIVNSSFISAARVHIANGTSNPFRRTTSPTASVSVTPTSGSITANQARSVRYLVASAVAGLSPEDVTVIDANGAIISGAEQANEADAADSRAEKLKLKVERLLEARVGAGNAIVEVNIQAITEREEIREIRIDPESRILISSDTEETSDTSKNSGGSQVTVASNLPDGDAATDTDSTSQRSQSRERVNYEVSQTEREVLKGPGEIKRLTVAVLLNLEVTEDNGEPVFVERTDEEMASLRQLVESATGFDESRGDVVTIKSMALKSVEPLQGTAQTSGFDLSSLDIMSVIQMIILALVCLILGLFVVKPILKNSQVKTLGNDAEGSQIPQIESSDTGAAQNSTQAEVIDQSEDLESIPDSSDLPVISMMSQYDDADNPVERLRGMIEERQSETVEILRGWLEEKEKTT